MLSSLLAQNDKSKKFGLSTNSGGEECYILKIFLVLQPEQNIIFELRQFFLFPSCNGNNE